MLVLPFSARNLSEALVQDLYTRAPVTRLVDDGKTTSTRGPTLRPLVANAPAVLPRRTTSLPTTSSSTSTATTTTTTTTTTTSTTTASPPTTTTAAPTLSPALVSAPSDPGTKFGASYSAHTPTRVKIRRPLRKPVKRPSDQPLSASTATTAAFTTSVAPVEPLHVPLEVLEESSPPPVLYMTPTSDDHPPPPSPPPLPLVSPHKYASHYSADRLRPTSPPLGAPLVAPGTSPGPVGTALHSLGLAPDAGLAFPHAVHTASYKAPLPPPPPRQAPTPPPPPPPPGSILPSTQGAAAAAPSLAEDLQALLASWGLLPGAAPPPPPTLPPAPAAGAAYGAPAPAVDALSYSSFKPLPPLPLESTSAVVPNGADASSGEMRDFLAAFGLVSDPDSARSQRSRSLKSGIRKPNPLDFPTDMLTEDHRGVLRSLGLLADAAKEATEKRAARNMVARKVTTEGSGPEDQRVVISTSKEHVFNPAQHLAALRPTPEEVRRLNKLLDTFKKYNKEMVSPPSEDADLAAPETNDSSTASDSFPKSESTTPLDLIAEESEITTRFPDESEIPGTTKPAATILPLHKAPAPSPLDLSELLLLLNATKNEVKRQQGNDSTSSPTSASASSSATSAPSASSETTADKGASADDLAASFGGTLDEEPSSTPPPSGLYFLVDWNSFLEVGDPDGEKRVNVRIAPKVGDARRFLPVTVP